MYIFAAGTTSQIIDIAIRNTASTNGSYKTGLTNASITAYYSRTDQGNAAATQISLSAGTRGTYSSGGFVEKDSTNAQGLYELGLPTGVCAAGSAFAIITIQDAATNGVAPQQILIQLSPAVNTSQWNGTAVSSPATAGIPDVNIKNISNAAVNIASAQIGVNVIGWNTSLVATPNVAGVPIVDTGYLLGTSYSTPATAGIVDVNIKKVNNVTVNGNGSSPTWGP